MDKAPEGNYPPIAQVVSSNPPGEVTVRYTIPSAAQDGGVFTFGNAPFNGSLAGTHLNGPIVGIAPTNDNGGYWLAGDDGGVYTFGSARFYGSEGSVQLSSQVSGITALTTSNGYWMVSEDGGVTPNMGSMAVKDLSAVYGKAAQQHPAQNSPVTPDLESACVTLYNPAACVTVASKAIDAARASEGVGPSATSVAAPPDPWSAWSRST